MQPTKQHQLGQSPPRGGGGDKAWTKHFIQRCWPTFVGSAASGGIQYTCGHAFFIWVWLQPKKLTKQEKNTNTAEKTYHKIQTISPPSPPPKKKKKKRKSLQKISPQNLRRKYPSDNKPSQI